MLRGVTACVSRSADRHEMEGRAFSWGQGLIRLAGLVALASATVATTLPGGAAIAASPTGRPFALPHNGAGLTGSDQRGVAYRPGVGRLTGRRFVRTAPRSRLFYTGWGGWEPTIGIDARGTIFYGSYSTNLKPLVIRSRDGGRTWTDVSPPNVAASLDPYLWLDPLTGRIFDVNLQPSVTCAPVSMSDSQGRTWTTSNACGESDHETVFGGPAPVGSTQPTGYPHVVYYCAISGGALAGGSTYTGCLKSLDGGTTWQPAGAPAYPPRVVTSFSSGGPYCDGGVGHGIVDSSGTAYLPRAWCGPPYLSISSDEGLSWRQVEITTNPALSIPADGDHEAGVAVDGRGNVYYSWVAQNHHPYLAISRDGGDHWARPVDVMPPGVTQISAFTIEIQAGRPGHVDMLYVGTPSPPRTPVANQVWTAYLLQSGDALSPRPLYYATALSNPRTNYLWKGACGDIRCGNMGDFLRLELDKQGRPWAALVDACPVTPGAPGKQCGPVCSGLDNGCPNDPSLTEPRGEAVVGTLVQPRGRPRH